MQRKIGFSHPRLHLSLRTLLRETPSLLLLASRLNSSLLSGGLQIFMYPLGSLLSTEANKLKDANKEET